MLKLLAKELKLTASILSYVFIVFALMAFLPGYPILVGTFFCCLGIFQTFQAAREANDTLIRRFYRLQKEVLLKRNITFAFLLKPVIFSLPQP